jgi:hypothetical protein
MAASSITVVGNALLLKRWRPPAEILSPAPRAALAAIPAVVKEKRP